MHALYVTYILTHLLITTCFKIWCHLCDFAEPEVNASFAITLYSGRQATTAEVILLQHYMLFGFKIKHFFLSCKLLPKVPLHQFTVWFIPPHMTPDDFAVLHIFSLREENQSVKPRVAVVSCNKKNQTAGPPWHDCLSLQRGCLLSAFTVSSRTLHKNGLFKTYCTYCIFFFVNGFNLIHKKEIFEEKKT